jgi:hypothetical protein
MNRSHEPEIGRDEELETRRKAGLSPRRSEAQKTYMGPLL